MLSDIWKHHVPIIDLIATLRRIFWREYLVDLIIHFFFVAVCTAVDLGLDLFKESLRLLLLLSLYDILLVHQRVTRGYVDTATIHLRLTGLDFGGCCFGLLKWFWEVIFKLACYRLKLGRME